MSNNENNEQIEEQEAEQTAAEGSVTVGEKEEAVTEEEEKTEVERLQEELTAAEDKVLRKTAEFENYRRRMRETRKLAREEGKAEVLKNILDVVDDFERSLQAADQAAEDNEVGPAFKTLKEGVELVYSKLTDELGKLGVERLEAEGVPFDEQEHDAMMQKEAPEDVASGTVLQEVQPGYRMGDRILRHAKVVVAQ